MLCWQEGMVQDNIYTTNIIIYCLFNFNPTTFNVSIFKLNMHLVFKWRKFNIKSKLLKKTNDGQKANIMKQYSFVLYVVFSLIEIQ